MDHFVKSARLNIIHRRQVVPIDLLHLEVSFCSMESPEDYFLWIIVPLKYAPEIINGMKQLV